MVGMARCAVPARVVAGGRNARATLAIEGVAPLHAARTSQRDVPTTLNRRGFLSLALFSSGEERAASRVMVLSSNAPRHSRTLRPVTYLRKSRHMKPGSTLRTLLIALSIVLRIATTHAQDKSRIQIPDTDDGLP